MASEVKWFFDEKEREKLRKKWGYDECAFAEMEFSKHFGYRANRPGYIYDREKFKEVLIKCIKDNFDYTVELYGTVPIKRETEHRVLWD